LTEVENIFEIEVSDIFSKELNIRDATSDTDFGEGGGYEHTHQQELFE
jgi:hypothetical protein